jgi:hypothetical protein
VLYVQQDVYTAFVDYCGGLCSSAVDTVVARLSDLLQSIAPESTPRHKVRMPACRSLLSETSSSVCVLWHTMLEPSAADLAEPCIPAHKCGVKCRWRSASKQA